MYSLEGYICELDTTKRVQPVLDMNEWCQEAFLDSYFIDVKDGIEWLFSIETDIFIM